MESDKWYIGTYSQKYLRGITGNRYNGKISLNLFPNNTFRLFIDQNAYSLNSYFYACKSEITFNGKYDVTGEYENTVKIQLNATSCLEFKNTWNYPKKTESHTEWAITYNGSIDHENISIEFNTEIGCPDILKLQKTNKITTNLDESSKTTWYQGLYSREQKLWSNNGKDIKEKIELSLSPDFSFGILIQNEKSSETIITGTYELIMEAENQAYVRLISDKSLNKKDLIVDFLIREYYIIVQPNRLLFSELHPENDTLKQLEGFIYKKDCTFPTFVGNFESRFKNSGPKVGSAYGSFTLKIFPDKGFILKLYEGFDDGAADPSGEEHEIFWRGTYENEIIDMTKCIIWIGLTTISCYKGDGNLSEIADYKERPDLKENFNLIFKNNSISFEVCPTNLNEKLQKLPLTRQKMLYGAMENWVEDVYEWSKKYSNEDDLPSNKSAYIRLYDGNKIWGYYEDKTEDEKNKNTYKKYIKWVGKYEMLEDTEIYARVMCRVCEIYVEKKVGLEKPNVSNPDPKGLRFEIVFNSCQAKIMEFDKYFEDDDFKGILNRSFDE